MKTLRIGKRNRHKPEADSDLQSFAWLKPALAVHARAVLGIATAAVLVLAGIGTLEYALDRPIARLEVHGQFHRVAPIQVEEAVVAFRGAGLLSVDLQALRASLEKIPWVDTAKVERRWPSGLHVLITEHVPAARWGEAGLMNVRGELFLSAARHIPPELPQLIGPQGTQSQVANLYLEIYPRLLAVGMRLTQVELDPRGAWQLTLGNGVRVRLGRQEVHERLERFIRVASPMVAARGGAVDYVDLRYSSGFSIGWHPPATRVAQGAEAQSPDV